MTYLDMWVDGSSANRMDYVNPKLDELVAEARTDTDLSNRYKTLLEIEKVLLEEDAAVAPLYQRGNTYLTRPSIENLVIHPAGADLSLKWASVK
jgi:oligopeptide transport system substrate-binding protein